MAAPKKKGFYRPDTITLDFQDDHELAGLEVELERISIARWKEIRIKYDGLPWEDQVDELAELLVAWNVVDKTGAEIPATREEFCKKDPAFHLLLLRAWGASILPIPLVRADPEPEPKPDSALEASIPMEAP